MERKVNTEIQHLNEDKEKYVKVFKDSEMKTQSALSDFKKLSENQESFKKRS